MSLRGLVLGACASLIAVLVAWAAWAAADILAEALGLGPLRPLILLSVLVLSLTALQAVWDRIERIVGPLSHSGHVSEGSAE